MNEDSNKGKRPAMEDTLVQLMLDTTNTENENEDWKMVERKKKKARKQNSKVEKNAGETCNIIGQKSGETGEDQSEEEMEVEGEGDTPVPAGCDKGAQLVNSDTVQQINTADIMAKRSEIRKREAYMREDGILKHISEIDVNYKVTLRMTVRAGTAKKDANNAIKKINEDKGKNGYSAGIEDRDTLLTKPEDVLKIERMVRRKWNKEENKIEFEPIDSVIITFKGNQPRDKISFFNDLAVLRVRLYVAPVMQYYKCFRYGHRKVHCKSEECCINCGERAHGHCDKPTKCRNCGESHKSTDRRCDVYERNQRIKKVMAYNNASYREAIEILEGSDEGPTEVYDRYEKPNNWPLLSKPRQKTSQRQKSLYRDKVISKANSRKGKGKEEEARNADDTSSDDLPYLSLDNSGFIRQKRKREDGRRKIEAPRTRTTTHNSTQGKEKLLRKREELR
ncbi:hypothetical protein P5V15_012846 [Pogonomyrmex californicus]